jgi:hypothetical protein
MLESADFEASSTTIRRLPGPVRDSLLSQRRQDMPAQLISRTLTATVRLDRSLRRVTNSKFYWALGFVCFGFWAAGIFQSGKLFAPPQTTGDEICYDCIAVQIWRSHTFACDFRDKEFRAAYGREEDPPSPGSALADRLERHSGPTTYWPPLLPTILSGSYAAFGRNFVAIRLFNTACAAATVSITAWLCRIFAGPVASFIAAGLMILAGYVQTYGASILTESFSALMVGVCVLLMSKRLATHPRSTGATMGIAWGLAILMRNSFVLWLPAVLVGIVASVAPAEVVDVRSCFKRRANGLVAACLFLAGVLAVAAPWWFRNCRVLGAFMPLGAQGYMELPAGFSDVAIAHRGVWVRLLDSGFYDQPLASLPQNASRAEFERLTANYGRQSAVAWIRAHPTKLPALTAQKIWSEWKPAGTTGALVLFAAIFGGAFLRGSMLVRACLTMILGDILMIAATWSVEGRFIFPVAVPVYALAGIGGWLLLRCIGDLRGELQVRTEMTG